MLKRLAIIFSGFLLFFLCAAFSYGAEADQCADRVVAVVNDDVITLTEIEKAGFQYFETIKAQAPPREVERALEQGREQVLSSLVDSTIVRQKALELGMSVEESDIDSAVAEMLGQNNATKEEFIRDLAKSNMTEQDYRNSIRDQILQARLINSQVKSRIVILEENMEEYYHKEYSQEKGESGYYILQMGFNWKNPGKLKRTGFDSKEEVLRKAEEIRARVLAGENFAELAKSYSDFPSAVDGGDIGLIKKDEMAAYMKDTILPMQPGEITQIIETDTTFQFFKLLSVTEGDVVSKVPFESVKDEIREILYNREMEEQYNVWVESLREKAYVKILL